MTTKKPPLTNEEVRRQLGWFLKDGNAREKRPTPVHIPMRLKEHKLCKN